MAHLFALSACVLITIGLVEGAEFGKCRYRIDPHLTPFPSGLDDNPATYLCQSNSKEILVENQYLQIVVIPDPSQSFYPVIQVRILLLLFVFESFRVFLVHIDLLSNGIISSILCYYG